MNVTHHRYLAVPLNQTVSCLDINGAFSTAGVTPSMCNNYVPEAQDSANIT